LKDFKEEEIDDHQKQYRLYEETWFAVLEI
jgi:hypothetical protein